MKKVALNLLALLTVVFVFKSCSKDNSPENEVISAADITAIKALVTGGDWHIAYFFDTNKDDTSNFAGYVFNFNSDGTLGATDGNNSLSGAWSITDSNSSTTNSSSTVDFNIFFASPDNFKSLSEDWEILKYSSTKIELIHVSGGSGGTDALTFMKN